MKAVTAFCLAVLLLSGCGPTVLPRPDASGKVDPADGSITQETQGVAVTVRVGDLEVAPFRMVDTISSFIVRVENRRNGPVTLPLASFLLVGGSGEQFRPIKPAEVQTVVSRDSNYLIPYPYVGFYYLEDRERSAFSNTFESSLPFYAENYPQDLYLQALPVEPVLPGNSIAGEVYFPADLTLLDNFELRIYLDADEGQGSPDFSFPFFIEK